jgi:hypothetical protein
MVQGKWGLYLDSSLGGAAPFSIPARGAAKERFVKTEDRGTTRPGTCGRQSNNQRDDQRLWKDALDDANNDLNFVQPTPCPFTFMPPVPTLLPTR